jgi:hypothetical protein
MTGREATNIMAGKYAKVGVAVLVKSLEAPKPY